jgi:hypothetical protein
MSKQITAYQCAYCRKYGKSKSRIESHEKACVFNPTSRACPTCQNGFPIILPGYIRQGCLAGHEDFEAGRCADKVKNDCQDWEG